MKIISLVITAFFYLFISLVMPLKKIYKYLILGFSLLIFLICIFSETEKFKYYIIILLYLPLVLLGLLKNNIFKS